MWNVLGRGCGMTPRRGLRGHPGLQRGRGVVPVPRADLREVLLPARCWSCTTCPRTPPCRTRGVRAPRPAGAPVLNTYGPRPGQRDPVRHRRGAAPVAVVTMADGCDDPRQIDDLARLVDRGVVVAAASRYMPGGQQVGGPRFKGWLSRWPAAAVDASPGSAPATRPTRSRPTRPTFVREVGIESRTGFEIGIELTAKATPAAPPGGGDPDDLARPQLGDVELRRGPVDAQYLRWYRFAFGRRLDPEQLTPGGPQAGRGAGRPHQSRPQQGTATRRTPRHEGSGHRIGRLHRRLRRRGAARPRATRWSASTTTRSTARSPQSTTTTRYRFVEGDAATSS
jgi:dolichol-phosphate mannosyltransferase